jgi:Flp pilus assembly protein TadB
MKGLTLDGIWQFLCYAVTVFVIFLGIYKGICFVIDRRRDRKQRRREEIEAAQPDLADRVSKKVLSSLEPRLESIEKDLKKDKSRLDNHDLILSGLQDSQKTVKRGFGALFNVLIVASKIGSFNPNEPEMKAAISKMNDYLIDRLEDE